MTKDKFLVSVGILILAVFICCEQGKAPETKSTVKETPESMITVADVAQVTGLEGITAVTRDVAKDIKGDLNFAKDDGVIILSVNFIGIDEFNQYKEQMEYIQGPVSGIGDEAMSAPKGDMQNILFVHKGDRAMVFTSMIDASGDWVKPFLTVEQLGELAKKMLAKMATLQQEQIK